MGEKKNTKADEKRIEKRNKSDLAGLVAAYPELAKKYGSKSTTKKK